MACAHEFSSLLVLRPPQWRDGRRGSTGGSCISRGSAEFISASSKLSGSASDLQKRTALHGGSGGAVAPDSGELLACWGGDSATTHFEEDDATPGCVSSRLSSNSSTSCVYSVIGSGCQLASSTVALSWPARFAFPVKEKSASSRPPHCRIAKRLVIATSEPQERSLSRSASVKGSTEQRQRRACFFSSSGFGGRPRERLAPLVAAPAAAGDAIEHQFGFS